MVTIAGLLLNKTSHECRLNGEQIKLTPTEFSILWLLCKTGERYIVLMNYFRLYGEKSILRTAEIR